MTPRTVPQPVPAVPLWDILGVSNSSIACFFGKSESDQALASWLCYALNASSIYNYARTPEEKKLMKTAFEKAVRMIGQAALNYDEEFFARWTRGRKELKAIDPRVRLTPEISLLAAYNFCTASGCKTSQTEVIQTAIDFLAIARINGLPNRIPRPSQKPTRAQIDAEIERGGLKTIGWRAYIKKLGLTFPDRGKRGRPTGWRKR